jgi:tetratricopeptide (TPR) repeat protein
MDRSALPASSERAHRTRATALHCSFLACGEVANASNFDILAVPPVGLPARAGERAAIYWRSSIVQRRASPSLAVGRRKTRFSNLAISILSSRGRPAISEPPNKRPRRFLLREEATMNIILKRSGFNGGGRHREPRQMARSFVYSGALVTFAAIFSISNAGAAPKDDWAGCRSANPGDRIAGCTGVIDHIAKESRHNKIAAYFNRAGAYAAKADWDRAIADYTKALEFDPKSATILSARAVAYRGKGDLDRALAEYSAVLSGSPRDAAAHLGRGEIYHLKADYDHAIADYDEAIKLDAKNAAAFSARAIAWRLKGDGEKALADLSEAVKLDKKTAAALNARGAFYQSKADFEHALADFSDAIKRDPKAPQSYSNRGLAYHAKGDLDHAIADFDEAIKRDPNYAAAYLNRANAWRAKKDLDRAKQDYEAALKLKPDLASARKGLDEVEKLIAKKAATAAPAASH